MLLIHMILGFLLLLLLIALFLHNLSMKKKVLFTKESVEIGLVVIYLKIIAGISDTSEA